MECNFWNDFFANFLSDLAAGVIIAIFGWIVINWWWNRKQQGKEARSRKIKMLTLIRGELNHNLEVLASRKPSDPHIVRDDTLERFKDELWNAFSDGGELQWIRDLELLDSLATAYYRTRAVIAIEDSCRQRLPTARMYDSATGDFFIVQERLKAADDELSKALNLAIVEIDKALSSARKKR